MFAPRHFWHDVEWLISPEQFIRETYSYSVHLSEHSPLEGLLPQRQVRAQLHAEGMALAVAHQHAEAEGLAVPPQLTVLL